MRGDAAKHWLNGRTVSPGGSADGTEAIDSFTKSGAVASFEEGKKGEIANGQLADFVVLSEDPFKADANTLHRIEAKATYLGGKCVYKK